MGCSSLTLIFVKHAFVNIMGLGVFIYIIVPSFGTTIRNRRPSPLLNDSSDLTTGSMRDKRAKRAWSSQAYFMKRSDEISLEGNILSSSVTLHSYVTTFSDNESSAEMIHFESDSISTAGQHHVSCACASLHDNVHPSQIKFLSVPETTQDTALGGAYNTIITHLKQQIYARRVSIFNDSKKLSWLVSTAIYLHFCTLF